MGTSCRVGDGIAPFCKQAKATEFKGSGEVDLKTGDVGVTEKQIFCEFCETEIPHCEAGRPRNLVANAVDLSSSYEVDDANTQAWVSPRVSFSQDFIKSFSQRSVSHDEKRGEHDTRDNYSAEFEFLKPGPGYCAADQAKGFMLSADELFFDGKLLPLPFPSVCATGDDLSEPGQHRQETTLSLHTLDGQPLTRNLSFALPKSSSSLSLSLRSKCACISLPPDSGAHIRNPSLLQPLPSTTVSKQPSPLSSLSASSSLSMSLKSSSVAKCSTKLKAFFQTKGLSKDIQVTRSSTSAPTCRPPTASRSFWRFSRSKSACESKTMFPLGPPCRSNSAGGSHSCADLSQKDHVLTHAAGPSKSQGSVIATCRENPFRVHSKPPVVISSDTCVDSAEAVDNGSLGYRSSSEKASGQRIKDPSGSRRRDSSGAKANGGKLVLRNLERCSAEKKQGREARNGLNRRGSFSVGARITPVLNVAVYRGLGTSKVGLFGFSSPVLLAKKDRSTEETAINWRNGA